jgi:hypothetical protein
MTRRSLLLAAPLAAQTKKKTPGEPPVELLINLPGPQTIKLSQFRGKVTLVSFLLTT